ncbi:MAG: hypothetical protein E7348_01650 [Clostridiales bacterium]|nr:hypothetical protein [Clostridiales bacterium]
MKSFSKTQQIKIGAVISYLAIIVSTLSALLYTPWMKDKIGDANYGLYTLVGSLIAIFLMDFGLSTAVTRFVSKFRAENDDVAIKDILGCVFKLYFIIDVIIALILVVVYFFLGDIYQGLTPLEIETLKKIYIVFGAYSVFSFPFMPLPGILNAYEKFIQLKLCDMLQKVLTVLLVVVALLCDYGVVELVAMNALAGIITIGVRLIILKVAKIGRPNFAVKNKEMLKSLLGFSIWVTILAFAQRMIFNFASSILGMVSNSMEIARFAPASQLEGYFYTFAFAINGLFMPTVARYDHQKDEKSFYALLEKVGRYQICVLGLLFVGLTVLGTDFMQLWMGEEYKISGICVMLLIFPCLLMYPQQIANTLISIKNKIKYQAICFLSIGILNIILSFILVPKLGALGSAISIGIAYFVNFILLNIVYKWQINLNLKNFYKKVYLKYLPLIALAIAISFLTCYFIQIIGWLGFVVKVIVCIIVYILIIGLMGFSHQERKNIFATFKKKLTRRTNGEKIKIE